MISLLFSLALAEKETPRMIETVGISFAGSPSIVVNKSGLVEIDDAKIIKRLDRILDQVDVQHGPCYEVRFAVPRDVIAFEKNYCPNCSVIRDPTYNPHEHVEAVAMRSCFEPQKLTVEVTKDGKTWQLLGLVWQ